MGGWGVSGVPVPAIAKTTAKSNNTGYHKLTLNGLGAAADLGSKALISGDRPYRGDSKRSWTPSADGQAAYRFDIHHWS